MRAAVLLGSELLGEVAALVVSIDPSVIVLHCSDWSCVRFGEVVTVHFPIAPEDDLVVRCRVIERGAGGLVLEVLDLDDNLPLSLPGSRVLH